MTVIVSSAAPFPLAGLVRRYHSVVTLVIAGLLAIGVSGFVCAGLRWRYGANAVAGDTLSPSLSAARCADLRGYELQALTCSQAELEHHADEVVLYRELMLPLGVLLAIGYWFARRRWLRDTSEVDVVRHLRLGVGAGAFGLAALALIGTSLGHATTAGLGRNLSDGLVALAAAAAYGVAVLRTTWP